MHCPLCLFNKFWQIPSAAHQGHFFRCSFVMPFLFYSYLFLVYDRGLYHISSTKGLSVGTYWKSVADVLSVILKFSNWRIRPIYVGGAHWSTFKFDLNHIWSTSTKLVSKVSLVNPDYTCNILNVVELVQHLFMNDLKRGCADDI